MTDRDSTREPAASCAEDLPRIRELADLLARERAERLRLEQACEETKKLVHSLNNALSIITTFAASLSDEIDADHAAREAVDEIARAAKRAGTISRKLGDLQRRTSKE